jgi:membrane associated rhomboid family serine protease
MKIINRLERKLYRLQIQPFFKYIILTMAGVYALQLFFPSFGLISLLSLYMPWVYKGEVWRLLSFLIVPPAQSPLYALLHLYFYYFIGTALENKWGQRRFLLYFVIGAAGALLAALLTQVGTNYYLFMSMFFAYALIYPEQEMLLFFVLPIKMKWLALFNALLFIYMFINGRWPDRVSLIFSLLNLFLFFGGDILNLIRNSYDLWNRKRVFKSAQRK